MPNWCYNDEIIVGPKNEIVEFYDKLREWTSKNYIENGFGTNWIGNIVLGAGFKNTELKCRGEIVYDFDLCTDEDECMISFKSETAWVDVHETWYEILKKHAPNCKYYFQSEECGCDYYATNDKESDFFPERYYFKQFIDNKDCFPACDLNYLNNFGRLFSEKEMTKFLQKFLGKNDDNVLSLIELFNKKSDEGKFGEDNLFKIYPYEIVD